MTTSPYLDARDAAAELLVSLPVLKRIAVSLEFGAPRRAELAHAAEHHPAAVAAREVGGAVTPHGLDEGQLVLLGHWRQL